MSRHTSKRADRQRKHPKKKKRVPVLRLGEPATPPAHRPPVPSSFRPSVRPWLPLVDWPQALRDAAIVEVVSSERTSCRMQMAPFTGTLDMLPRLPANEPTLPYRHGDQVRLPPEIEPVAVLVDEPLPRALPPPPPRLTEVLHLLHILSDGMSPERRLYLPSLLDLRGRRRR